MDSENKLGPIMPEAAGKNKQSTCCRKLVESPLVGPKHGKGVLGGRAVS